MSLRFDTNSEGVVRTANVPNNTAFTFCVWLYIVSDLGNGVMQGVFTLNSAQYTCWIYWNHSASPGATLFGTYDNIGATFGINGFAKPSTGQWVFMWMRCAGTGANQQEGGYALAGQTSFTKAATTMTTGRNNPTFMVLGNDNNPGSQGANMRAENFKCWDAALTDDELLREMMRRIPSRTANLNCWHPMMDVTLANNLIDFSGNGRNLTANGTLTVEDGPPIAWGG